MTFDWINFLDEFIIQLYDDHMVAFFRERRSILTIPTGGKQDSLE